MTDDDFAGQTELFIEDEGNVSFIAEPYSGRLVLTAHSTRDQIDPNELTRELEQWMRRHHLSRVEAYWNYIPPEDSSG